MVFKNCEKEWNTLVVLNRALLANFCPASSPSMSPPIVDVMAPKKASTVAMTALVRPARVCLNISNFTFAAQVFTRLLSESMHACPKVDTC